MTSALISAFRARITRWQMIVHFTLYKDVFDYFLLLVPKGEIESAKKKKETSKNNPGFIYTYVSGKNKKNLQSLVPDTAKSVNSEQIFTASIQSGEDLRPKLDIV